MNLFSNISTLLKSHELFVYHKMNHPNDLHIITQYKNHTLLYPIYTSPSTQQIYNSSKLIKSCDSKGYISVAVKDEKNTYSGFKYAKFTWPALWNTIMITTKSWNKKHHIIDILMRIINHFLKNKSHEPSPIEINSLKTIHWNQFIEINSLKSISWIQKMKQFIENNSLNTKNLRILYIFIILDKLINDAFNCEYTVSSSALLMISKYLIPLYPSSAKGSSTCPNVLSS